MLTSNKFDFILNWNPLDLAISGINPGISAFYEKLNGILRKITILKAGTCKSNTVTPVQSQSFSISLQYIATVINFNLPYNHDNFDE